MFNISEVINEAKKYQLKIIKDYKKDPYGLADHFAEMEKWAARLFEIFPEVDQNVVLLSVWLHDTGHYPIVDLDHAVKSEKLARKFLSGKVEDEILNKVCKAVRAHRCKDVLPETREEKIVACIDSASHMTDNVYVSIAKSGRYNYCLAKMARDYRDTGLIMEVQQEIEPLYKAWVNLIAELNRIEITKETETYTEKG